MELNEVIRIVEEELYRKMDDYLDSGVIQNIKGNIRDRLLGSVTVELPNDGKHAVGKFVRCVSRYKQAEHTLTIGKEYEIVKLKKFYHDEDSKFGIMADNGVLRYYNIDNSQFELI